MTELDKFMCDLSDYLITIPDTHPVVEYVGVNSNSLLDWKQTKADTELQGWSHELFKGKVYNRGLTLTTLKKLWQSEISSNIHNDN